MNESSSSSFSSRKRLRISLMTPVSEDVNITILLFIEHLVVFYLNWWSYNWPESWLVTQISIHDTSIKTVSKRVVHTRGRNWFPPPQILFLCPSTKAGRGFTNVTVSSVRGFPQKPRKLLHKAPLKASMRLHNQSLHETSRGSMKCSLQLQSLVTLHKVSSSTRLHQLVSWSHQKLET